MRYVKNLGETGCGTVPGVLEQCGDFPETGRAADGQHEAVLRRCPIWALAREHESLCEDEQRFFGLVLANDSPGLARRRHRRRGEQVCSFVFPAPGDETTAAEQVRSREVRE